MTEWGQYPIEREIETLKEDEEKQSERERERGARLQACQVGASTAQSDYGNYGIFLNKGNLGIEGFISSTVVPF